MKKIQLSILSCALLTAGLAFADNPELTVDLADVGHDENVVTRVYGASGEGHLGLPVATGSDLDGDGFLDFAVAFFQADPFGRENAGQVDLIFGNGSIGGFIDTAEFSPRVLQIAGEGVGETAGSEIWIDDVTGDGLGDLLICRQNYTPGSGRIGAGALTIVVGSPNLRSRAAVDALVDLGSPPAEFTLTTLVGVDALDRFGIWVRTGDLDGDGIADLVVGADQENAHMETHRGAVYVLRGGSHLAAGGTFDLEDFGQGPLDGHLAKIEPPLFSNDFHFGATNLISDLDANGKGEVLVAATLARGGAFLPPEGGPPGGTHSTGGPPAGYLYIAWDDNFPAGTWPAGYTVDLEDPPGSMTLIRGATGNVRFGEELLGGLDYDADGRSDLFVGDIAGNGALIPNAGPTTTKNGNTSGLGHVFYDSAALKGLDFDLDNLPDGQRTTTIFGPLPTALGGDTAAHGDFNADGIADLMFTAPHDKPLARSEAGSIFLFFGRVGGWPQVINTRVNFLPSSDLVRTTRIIGANATDGRDIGDTLGYSAAAADIDGDGHTDLITNEMVGNGLGPDAEDVGNLIVVSGAALGGEVEGGPTCVETPTALCLQGDRFRVEVEWRDFIGTTGNAEVVPTNAAPEDSGLLTFFDPANWEMLVKVLDGCDVNDRIWVFAAAVTNVEYTLKVTDTVSGEIKEYFNPLGTSADATTDTDAFASCP